MSETSTSKRVSKSVKNTKEGANTQGKNETSWERGVELGDVKTTFDSTKYTAGWTANWAKLRRELVNWKRKVWGQP